MACGPPTVSVACGSEIDRDRQNNAENERVGARRHRAYARLRHKRMEPTTQAHLTASGASILSLSRS